MGSVGGRAVLCDHTSWFDLAALAGDESLADPMAAVARHTELHALQDRLGASAPGGSLEGAAFDACVPRPSKVFGIGLNYRSHAEESNLPIPSVPLTFTKFPSCIVGPHADVTLSGPAVDWEVELVAVIGTGGRRIPQADAWSHVAGLTVGQDVSDRHVQFSSTPPQFSLGKSFDTFGPLGGVLVSPDAVDDPDDVRIWCSVDGEVMQDARTSDLIFPVPELVAYLSSICTLHPGDVIFTGTPAGVGAGRQRFLRHGEVVESGAEGIGTLRNRCVADGGAA